MWLIILGSNNIGIMWPWQICGLKLFYKVKSSKKEMWAMHLRQKEKVSQSYGKTEGW